MFDALDRVRERSQTERRAIAFSIAGVITGVIFILWAVSFFASIQSEEKVVTELDDTSGFDLFANPFKEATNIIRQEVGSAKEQFELINTELQKSEVDSAGVDDSSEVIAPGGDAVEVPSDVEDSPASKDTEVTDSGIEIIQI